MRRIPKLERGAQLTRLLNLDYLIGYFASYPFCKADMRARAHARDLGREHDVRRVAWKSAALRERLSGDEIKEARTRARARSQFPQRLCNIDSPPLPFSLILPPKGLHEVLHEAGRQADEMGGGKGKRSVEGDGMCNYV